MDATDNVKEFYSTRGAAEYLGVAVATIKYHTYKSKRLKPDGKIGKSLIFTRETLDSFRVARYTPEPATVG